MNRYGVEINLLKSPYVYDMIISRDMYSFHFSSENRLKRFKSKINYRCKEVNKKYADKYNLMVNMNLLTAINLYQEIEIKGFCLLKKWF